MEITESFETRVMAEIAATPASNAARQVYADWLDERGDIRGEFLRLELQLEQMPPHDHDHGAVRDRLRSITEVVCRSDRALATTMHPKQLEKWHSTEWIERMRLRYEISVGANTSYYPPTGPRPDRVALDAGQYWIQELLETEADHAVWILDNAVSQTNYSVDLDRMSAFRSAMDQFDPAPLWHGITRAVLPYEAKHNPWPLVAPYDDKRTETHDAGFDIFVETPGIELPQLARLLAETCGLKIQHAANACSQAPLVVFRGATIAMCRELIQFSQRHEHLDAGLQPRIWFGLSGENAFDSGATAWSLVEE